MQLRLSISALTLFAVLVCAPAGTAQSTDDCIMCQEEPTLISERTGQRDSLNLAGFQVSVHGALECVDCHADLSGAEFPYPERLADVDCGLCHDDIGSQYKPFLQHTLPSGQIPDGHCDLHGAGLDSGVPSGPAS